MTNIDTDAFVRSVLTSTTPDGSAISARDKTDLILARILPGAAPPTLRRLVALGIGKSARDMRRKEMRSHA